MRRLLLTTTTAVALLAGPGTAPAAQPAAPRASCVATITSYEATQLPAGSVGREVAGLATAGPGLVSALVSGLAREHLGSLEACAGAEA